MFLAQRLSATPYIYDFELDVDAALEGGPGPEDRAWMIAAAKRNAHDLFERVRLAPPGAFITMDLVPYTFPPDADADFASHCPEAAAWMRQHYQLAERFGTVRVIGFRSAGVALTEARPSREDEIGFRSMHAPTARRACTGRSLLASLAPLSARPPLPALGQTASPEDIAAARCARHRGHAPRRRRRLQRSDRQARSRREALSRADDARPAR